MHRIMPDPKKDWSEEFEDDEFIEDLDDFDDALEYLGDSRILLYDDQSQQENDYHGDTWRDDL